MTNFEGWAKRCKETTAEIWPISIAIDRPNTGLYMTKTPYWEGRDKFYYSPIYVVWIDDNREFVTLHNGTALGHWLWRIKELGFEVENFEQIDMEVE